MLAKTMKTLRTVVCVLCVTIVAMEAMPFRIYAETSVTPTPPSWVDPAEYIIFPRWSEKDDKMLASRDLESGYYVFPEATRVYEPENWKRILRIREIMEMDLSVPSDRKSSEYKERWDTVKKLRDEMRGLYEEMQKTFNKYCIDPGLVLQL